MSISVYSCLISVIWIMLIYRTPLLDASEVATYYCNGHQIIDNNNWRCCYLFDDNGRVIRERLYHLGTEQCCGGNVLSVDIVCCNHRYSMNTKTQVCCLHFPPQNKINPDQDRCCENLWMNTVQLYNSRTEVCIHNKVKIKRLECRNGLVQCGSKCYDPEFEICCSKSGTSDDQKMVYSKLVDGEQCCGERAYFTWTATCCNGHIYHTPGLKCCCNGTVPYHPSNQHCIEGKNDPKFCKVMGCPRHVQSKELLKDHFMKEQWLVVGARSVVQSMKSSQLVEINGEAISTEPKSVIKMVMLQKCYRKLHEDSIFFISKASSRKNNSIIVITDRDIAMTRKSLDKLVLDCTRTIFTNEHHKSSKCCQRVIKLCGNSGNQPGLSSRIVNLTSSGEILVSVFIFQMISVFHIL